MQRVAFFLLILVHGTLLVGQEAPGVPQNRQLGVSKISDPKFFTVLDTNGVIYIDYVRKSDSLVRQQDRSLSGILLSFTDSTMVLHVQDETVLSQLRSGRTETFIYSILTDTMKLHIDTVSFADIHSLRFDTGRHKQLIGLLQSAAYTYVVANLVAMTTVFIVQKKYIVSGSGANMLYVTGASLGAGALSYAFYPKLFLLNNHPKKRKPIKWELEIRTVETGAG